MPEQEQPIIDGIYLMERIAGKGGWTYVVLPHVPRDSFKPFNWLKVRGTIDSVSIEQYKLMPVKGGGLFFPIKTALRKTLKKEAGDTVRVIFYADDTPYGIPDELKECLQFEAPSYERFLQLSESIQKQYVEWIYEAKTEDTKAKRIGILITRMLE